LSLLEEGSENISLKTLTRFSFFKFSIRKPWKRRNVGQEVIASSIDNHATALWLSLQGEGGGERGKGGVGRAWTKEL
jgi:hypothetical protein